jgi:hypothetical protein
MLPFAFVLLGKNFYEPIGLTLSDTPIQKCGIVSDDKFLAASVTAKSAWSFNRGKPMAHRNRSVPIPESQTPHRSEMGQGRPHSCSPAVRLKARDVAIP